MQCPRCGAALPEGGTCPACGWVGEQLEGMVTGRTDEPAPVEFPDVCKTPADTPPGVPIPYPNIAKSADLGGGKTKTDGGPVCVPGAEATPSEGDEPGTGGRERGIGRLPGGAPLVAGIIIVLVIVVATFILLSGDRDDGPGTEGDLVIDPEGTSAVSVWEPTPGVHLAVLILNKGEGSCSLDGHDLLVTVLDGTEEVGRTTMVTSGDLAAGASRGVLINVGVDMTSGRTYKVDVLLRKDGGTVDAYHTEVTVPMS